MWKSACVGVYKLLNWKMHGETLKNNCLLKYALKCVDFPVL